NRTLDQGRGHRPRIGCVVPAGDRGQGRLRLLALSARGAVGWAKSPAVSGLHRRDWERFCPRATLRVGTALHPSMWRVRAWSRAFAHPTGPSLTPSSMEWLCVRLLGTAPR